MSITRSIHEVMAGEDRFYALLEPRGPLRCWWGAANAAAAHSLLFRKFHHPRKKEPSAWRDFIDLFPWQLSQHKSYKHSELDEQDPPRAPGHPGESRRDSWTALCGKAGEAIRSERAFKLVLSREEKFRLAPGEYESYRRSLISRIFYPQLENSYRFLIKSRDSLFFGATPELLFLREKGLLHVPAIAGTRLLRSGVPESTIREELLASEKDRAEHAWVVDGICDSLRSIGLAPGFPSQPVVLRVPGLLHLYTPITAKELRPAPVEKLIAKLHPTPAMGGHPQGAAVDFLYENEDWDRGLFASPLLFRSPGRDLCLVGIRSGLLTPDHLHFFAGAGFLKGSGAESEWRETANKLLVLQRILFGDSHA